MANCKDDWHKDCYACTGSYDRYYPSDPQHEDCTGTCGGRPSYEKPSVDACSGPCKCECRTPLTRNEVMEIRDLISKFRR